MTQNCDDKKSDQRPERVANRYKSDADSSEQPGLEHQKAEQNGDGVCGARPNGQCRCC